MKPQLLTVVAGVPVELGNRFEARFENRSSGLEIIARKDLGFAERYTDAYADSLYERLADKLKTREPLDRVRILANVNLVLLYAARGDGSESVLVERFGTEALAVPLRRLNRPVTRNQRGQVVNDLVAEAVEAIRNAQRLLAVITEEVTNRENKTCLLLPPKNLGKGGDLVSRCVHDAVLKKKETDYFKGDLQRVYRLLKKTTRDGSSYFVSQRGLIFRSPSKSGSRHGYAPLWSDSDHDLRCVLSGRLRFGVPYDPRFHYDCELTKSMSRDFPSCHGYRELPRERKHANISPNDNVR